jgi:hypothetical protein
MARCWVAVLVTPQVLITVINANDRISRVKPADAGQTWVNLGYHLENLTNEPY